MSQIQPSSNQELKVLVLFAHPDPENSLANQAMLQAIQGLEHVTVHDLYAAYPDFFIDIKREHQLLLMHDVIVFQHPLFMYSCPALLKEWMDVVLGKNFAFGQGRALEGKVWRSVVTAGGAEKAFTAQGYNQYSLEQILQPFELTAKLCRMQWLSPLSLYWARHISQVDRVEHAQLYRQWLMNIDQELADDNTVDLHLIQGVKDGE
ncbi:MAG: glutathione-regulated potassium-efflux system ancillary protein KefG [Vibrio sp.]